MIEASIKASPGSDDFDTLCGLVKSGGAIVLEGPNSIAVLEVIAEGPSLNTWIVGGDLEEILAMMPGAEAVARAMGCQWMSFGRGRKGWRRLLAQHGYVWNGVEHRKMLHV
jgi:hypothetical protein